MKKIENMSFDELRKEAISIKLTNWEHLDEKQLRDVLIVKRFISNRKNQSEAIMKAQEIRTKSNGTWFTLKELQDITRDVKKIKGRVVYGKPSHSIKELNSLIETLSLFGLMKRKLRPGKEPKYKVRMEAAVKAIAAHNKIADATQIILGKDGTLIKK